VIIVAIMNGNEIIIEFTSNFAISLRDFCNRDGIDKSHFIACFIADLELQMIHDSHISSFSDVSNKNC